MKIPGPEERWRCGHCGNLTRFDVRRSRTVDEYWHFSLAGDPDVSELAVPHESLDSVTCRWCGASDRIEVILRPDAEEIPPVGGTP